MNALVSDNWIEMRSLESLPNGVNVITVSCEDYTAYRQLPSVVSHDGDHYGLAGWSSDNLKAYYRTDKMRSWVRFVNETLS